MEEVRRELIKQFGEAADKGSNSLYAGGLWVRSSMVPTMQDAAAQALRDGLANFDGGRGWRDLGMSIDLTNGDWAAQLDRAPVGVGFPDWKKAVVLAKAGGVANIGFANGATGTLPASAAAMPKRGVGGAARASYAAPPGRHDPTRGQVRSPRAAPPPRPGRAG